MFPLQGHSGSNYENSVESNELFILKWALKVPLQQYGYLVTKSSNKIFFCRPISNLGDKIFYLSPNINLRRRNLYFGTTFQNIDYIGRRITYNI